MRFDQKEDGSCDICFTDEEIKILKTKKKLHLSAEGLRHFGNNLVKIVGDFQVYFNKDIKNLSTKKETIIEGEEKNECEDSN